MKKLFGILLLMFTFVISANAQGTAVGSSSSYDLSGSDVVLKVYPPSFFGRADSFSVGAFFEKGASEDTLSKIRVFYALSQAALDAGVTTGEELTSTVTYSVSAEDEYQQTTFSLKPGHYVKVVLDRVATATDTSTVKPYIIVHN